MRPLFPLLPFSSEWFADFSARVVLRSSHRRRNNVFASYLPFRRSSSAVAACYWPAAIPSLIEDECVHAWLRRCMARRFQVVTSETSLHCLPVCVVFYRQCVVELYFTLNENPRWSTFLPLCFACRQKGRSHVACRSMPLPVVRSISGVCC